MKTTIRGKIGKTLAIFGLLTLPFAYSNFLPTSLSSDLLPDYIKNHFIREVTFGLTLVGFTVFTITRPLTQKTFRTIALLGSAVVVPFWIAWTFGWSVGGMEAVWGEAIDASGAYMIHVPQASLFFIGLAFLWAELRKQNSEET